MTAQALQTLIRTRIPLANFLQLRVQALEPDRAVVGAALEPNRNGHGALFAALPARA
ncbi:MAG: hypothetical protein FJY26_03265 [Betaproteobacteria bacterium]|nr:hypothetical protein [Betaproteobacteria bacterium]